MGRIPTLKQGAKLIYTYSMGLFMMLKIKINTITVFFETGFHCVVSPPPPGSQVTFIHRNVSKMHYTNKRVQEDDGHEVTVVLWDKDEGEPMGWCRVQSKSQHWLEVKDSGVLLAWPTGLMTELAT